MIFMRAQISIETETIVKFESLQTPHVLAVGVTTTKTFTATTMSRGKGLMYIAQMELYRTNQNKKQDSFTWTFVVCLSLLIANQPCEEIKLNLRSFNRAKPGVSVFN